MCSQIRECAGPRIRLHLAPSPIYAVCSLFSLLCCCLCTPLNPRLLCAPLALLYTLLNQSHFPNQVPSWVLPADVHMRAMHSGLHVAIDGVMDLRRTFWGVECAEDPARVLTAEHERGTAGHLKVDTRATEAAPAGGYQAIVPELCSWTIEASGSGTSSNMSGSGTSSSGSSGGPRRRPPGKTLTLHLALPPPSQEEITYKKGEREEV